MTFPSMYIIILTTFTSINLPPLPTLAESLPLVPPLLSCCFFFLNDQQFHLGCFVETRVRGCLQEPRYLKVSAPLKKVSSSSGHSSLPTDPLQTVGRSYCVQVATAAVSSGVKQTRHAQKPLF